MGVVSCKLLFTGFVFFLFVATGVMMKQGIIGKELMTTGDHANLE